MRKTCPHCGADFTIDLADAEKQPWAFAKCFACHGLTLVGSRQGVASLEFPVLPEFAKKPKAAPIAAVQLEPALSSIPVPTPVISAPILPPPLPDLFEIGPIAAAVAGPVELTVPVGEIRMVPDPLPSLEAVDSVQIQFYLKQIAVVVIFAASIMSLRWAISGDNKGDDKKVATEQDQVAVTKAVEVPPSVVKPVAPAVVQAQPQAVVASNEPLATVRVITASAVLRSGPGKQFARVATVRSDSKLNVRKRVAEWLEVDLEDGGTAWVRNDLVSVL